MALFKINKGPSTNLSSVKAHEGWAYFTTDDGKLYIDIAGSPNGSGEYVTEAELGSNRILLNAGHADAATHADTATELIPAQSKTFTGVIGTADNWANSTFFFGKVLPTSYDDLWTITYKVTAIAAGDARAMATSILTLNGYNDTYASYAAWNTIKNTIYRPCYQHVYYRAKSAGISNGYGHLMGLRLYSSWNYITTANARTITIEIIETKNCSFTFFDNMTKYADAPGSGSTNYNTYSEFDFANNGLQETGDSNTVDDPQIYFNAKTGPIGIWATSLFMEDGSGTYQNICTASDGTLTSNNRTTATTKIANTNGFKLGSNIYYTSTTYGANSNINSYSVIYNNVSLFDSRYAFNTSLTAGSLTAYKPVYLVGTIGTDGLFYLDATWWTQTPNEANKVYVLVGGCYDSTTSNCRISLYQHNSWYYYDGTTLQPLYAIKNHTHGNITNDGKIGTTTNLAVVTTTNGEITTANLATSNPDASGSETAFVATVSQDSKGKLTITRKYVQDGTTSQKGIVQIGSTASTVAAGDHNHNSTYLKLDGSNNMSADVNIITGDTDKFVNFWYDTNKKAGASWRIGALGSGTSDTNYFVIQSGTSATNATTWNNVFRVGQNTYDIQIIGNLYPSVTNTKTLGTSSLKWANVYATTFTGNLTGNAASATGFATAKTIALTGHVTGSATGGNGDNGWSISTTIGNNVITNGMIKDGEIQTGKLASNSISIAGNSIVLGSSLTADTLRTSLGLSNAMHFIGVTTTNISSSTNTATIVIDGSNVIAKNGDVVLYNKQEWVWGNSKWNLLGDESSYKIKQTAKDSPSADGNTNAFIDTIQQNANGEITATKKSVTKSNIGLGNVTNDAQIAKSVLSGAYDILYSSAANTPARLAANTTATKKFLRMTGTGSAGAAPAWDTVTKSDVGLGNVANSIYAGGTAVTLNGISKASNSASFYAPTNAGENGQFLKSAGAEAPTWVDITYPNIKPTVTKTYASTSYYGTNSYDASNSFYFMSVRPDSWYKPWKIRFKIRSYCPNYTNVDSITWCTLSGRADSMTYSNWNERYDTGHYYIATHVLKSAGFNASLGHAVGVNIRYGTNYTNSAYYRTFILDYYDCENCTVTILDNPVLWANWANNSDSNYNGYSNFNAVDRGLMETGDIDTTGRDYSHSGYGINGPDFRLAPNSIFGYDRNQKAQGISLYQSEYTSSTTNLSVNRVYNTAGFDWTRGLWYTNTGTNFAKNANLDFSPAEFYYAVDLRYTDNVYLHKTTASELGIVVRKPIYLRGTIGTDGMFYLAPMTVTHEGTSYKRVWTQTIPTTIDNYVYWFIGYPYYNGSYAASGYQINLVTENKLYWYHNGAFQEYIALADITNAIQALDVSELTNTAGKTINKISETNGKISVSFQDISITKSQISNFPTTMTPESHTHGYIQNNGVLQTNDVTIANGDKLIVTDASDSSKVVRTSISFDGSTTTKALTQKGTWETFNNYSHPTGDGNLHVPATSTSNNGKFLKAGSTAGSISWSDLPTASSSVAGITKVGASGGAAAYSHGTHVTTATVQSALSINTSSGSASKCLTEKGTFESFNNYSLPLAANGTRGGIQIGYSESGTNYAVKLSSEKAYVSVPWTDTKVTSSSNHYSPTTVSGSDKTASASGATAAWSIDVVKGITINTDGKGHITGLSVTSGKIPANPNTDTKVKQSASTTADWRKVLLHYKNDTTSTTAVTDSTEQVYGCVGISAQASTGTLRASKYNVNDKVTLQWNDTDQSLDFVFA